MDDHKVAYQSVPIVDTPPTVAELRRVLTLTGVEVKRLFNTSGEVYRAQGYAERLKTMSTDDALEALANNGKLIKRPLLVATTFALIGFDESAYAERLASSATQ